MIEEPGFWRYLSGRRNLEYFARASGPAADRRARLGRVDEVLRTVGLQDAATKKVKAYSQGMRQRLGIAQALLGAPKILVLDEPTNGLDPQGMREVRTLLRRLADEGVTVFVSSHLLSEVEAMCDRVGVLARGRLVAEGPPGELRGGRTLLRIEVDDRAARGGGPGRRRRRDARRRRDRAASACGWRRRRRPRRSTPRWSARAWRSPRSIPEHESLEDVFVSLVEGGETPR